jgi:rare lipoprotein A (peptidoglycan hydrolase)
VSSERLHVRAGRAAQVRGRVRPGAAGLLVTLEVRARRGWRTLDRDRTNARGAFVLRDRPRVAGSQPVRVRFAGSPTHRAARRVLGRLNAYRPTIASWYGPGLYGNHLACGGRLTAGTLGVAHKSLPCGTMVTFRYGGRSVRVPVVDRGPYVAGREYDLTAATAARLGFRGHGVILATR